MANNCLDLMHTDAVVCPDALISWSCWISEDIIKCSNILFRHLGEAEERQCVFPCVHMHSVCVCEAPPDEQESLYFVMLPVLQAVWGQLTAAVLGRDKTNRKAGSMNILTMVLSYKKGNIINKCIMAVSYQFGTKTTNQLCVTGVEYYNGLFCSSQTLTSLVKTLTKCVEGGAGAAERSWAAAIHHAVSAAVAWGWLLWL